MSYLSQIIFVICQLIGRNVMYVKLMNFTGINYKNNNNLLPYDKENIKFLNQDKIK